METQQLEQIITNELNREGSSVLLLNGEWGTGKTYFLKDFLKRTPATENFPKERRIYVSLFGKKSIEEVKTAMCLAFLQDKTPDSVGKHKGALMKWGVKILDGLKGKYLNTFKFNISDIVELFFKNSIICFDDFERIGSNELTVEILGLISHIKEQYKSKIILVMNEKKVENKDFFIHREKIIDVNLKFSSNPERASNLGLSLISKTLPPEDLPFLKACISELNIINIRIIKHISRIIQIIYEHPGWSVAKGHSGLPAEEERQYIIRNVVLTVWAYDNEFLDDLLLYAPLAKLTKQTDKPDEDNKRPSKLPEGLVLSYGFIGVMNVHRALATLVQNGYYENSGLDEVIARLTYSIERDKLFKKHIKLFWGTLKDNAEEIKDILVDFIDKYYHDMDLRKFSYYVLLLKDIGYKKLASQKIDWFLEKKLETSSAKFFKDPFPNDSGIDADLLAKAESIQKTFIKVPSLAEIFIENKELTLDGFNVLKSASVEDLRETISKMLDDGIYLSFHDLLRKTAMLSGENEANLLKDKISKAIDMGAEKPDSLLHKLRREASISHEAARSRLMPL